MRVRVLFTTCPATNLFRLTLLTAALVGTSAAAWAQPRQSPIHQAAFRGDVKKIERLLQEDGELVNSQGETRDLTPLHSAIQGGQVEAAKVLLDNGANIEADAFGEGRPLQLAVERRDRAMVRLLLERGAHPSATGRTEDATPIVKARGDPEMIKLLIKHGAKVDGTDRLGTTPLTYAAAAGNFRVVNLLLDAGASTDAVTRYPGGTALDAAIRGGHIEVAQLLLQRGATAGKSMGLPPLTDPEMKQPDLLANRLQLAIQANQQFTASCANGQLAKVTTYLRVFPHLAQSKDRNSSKPALMHAVSGGNIEIIKLLIDHGADPNKSESTDGTPLAMAIKLGNLKVIETLIENGANVNLRGIGSDPAPLHVAVGTGNTEVVEFLLRNGAAVNATARFGRSALAMAAARGDLEMAKLLVKHGANPKRGGREDDGLLSSAVQSGSTEMVRYLLDQGPSLRSRRQAMHTAAAMALEELVNLIADSGVELDAYTLLKLNKLAELDALLKKDPKLVQAPPTLKSGYGGRLLHIAAQEQSPNAAKLLLQHGADPNAQDQQGHTPLHAAALGGSLDCVKLLVQSGAKLNTRDSRGMTPLDVIDPEKNRDFRIRSYRENSSLYPLIREFLAARGATSGLFIPEGEKRTGKTVKPRSERGPGVQVGQWTLYPGAEYRVETADEAILIHNVDGKRYVEVTFTDGERQTRIIRDLSQEKPLILTRIEGGKEKVVHFKTTNDFRGAEPELLKRFLQFEQETYAGEVEGMWVLSGPAAATGPGVIGRN